MHHYDPVVVADQATGRPLVGVLATLIDAETLVPVQAYRDGNPTTLLSGAHGLIQEFQTEETTRRVQITAGPVTLHRWCQEMVGAFGGEGMTVATIQAMIRDELDAGNYAGPAGRSITSFGSQDPVTGVVPVHFSDGSTMQLTLPVGGGAVDEATLTQAIEDALADGNYAGPPGRGVLSFSSPDEAGVVIVYYDDGSSGELQLPAGGGSADEAALLAAYETAMG